MSIQTIPFPPSAERYPIYYEHADAQHCRETRALLHLIAQTDGAILEIGTHVGIKAMEIARNFPSRQVVTVDYTTGPATMTKEQDERPTPHETGMYCRHLPNVVCIDQNSRTLDYERLAAQYGYIGFIFIDGDHSDEGVFADSENALTYANRYGAIVAWHDFTDDAPEWVGVKRVLSLFAEKGLCFTEIENTRTAYTEQFAREKATVIPVQTLPHYVDVSNLPTHQQPPSLPEHWREEKIQAAIWTQGLPPQLTINGEPLPHAYYPPDCSKWKFRPSAGGNSIWEHLPRLADLASMAGVIVEIGIASMNGSTHAFDMGLQASEAAPGRKFHIGIDIHDSVSGPWVPKSPFWQYISGSSQDPATVEKVKRALTMREDGGEITLPIDILYIDTVHEYDFLKKELSNWLPLIGPNTLCLFHDTHRGGSYHEMTIAIEEAVEPPADGDWPLSPDGTPNDGRGPLYDTHEYHQFSTSCEGLGALVPKAGWPK